MRNEPARDCQNPPQGRSLQPAPTNSGPTINIKHQVVYPSPQFLEEDLMTVYPVNYFDPNMAFPMPQHPHSIHLPPRYHESMQQPYYHPGAIDMFVQDYSYWKPKDLAPHSWRPLSHVPPQQPIYPQSYYLPEDSKNSELRNRLKFSNYEFVNGQALVVPRPAKAQDEGFFEECFSPKRARRSSIHSDHSNEAQPKAKLIADEDDSTREILKVNFLNPLRQKKTQESAKADYIFNSERILIRQDTENKDRISGPENLSERIAQPISRFDQKGSSQMPAHPQLWMNPAMSIPRSDSPAMEHRQTPQIQSQQFINFGLQPDRSFGYYTHQRIGMPVPEAAQPQKPPACFHGHVPETVDNSNLKTQIQKAEAPIQNSSVNKIIEKPNPINLLSQKEEPKHHCTCKKSKCLKLYCECFASQRTCGESCNCVDCFNKEEDQDLRSYFLQDTLEKNPNAFKSKFKKIEGDNLTLHARGCNCKKTGCSKRYCECYSANTKCTPLCKCTECLNFCETIDETEAEKYHERVLRKRKRKSRTFVQSLLDRLKDAKACKIKTINP